MADEKGKKHSINVTLSPDKSDLDPEKVAVIENCSEKGELTVADAGVQRGGRRFEQYYWGT